MSKRLMLSILLLATITGGYYLYRMVRPASERLVLFRAWMKNPSAHPEWKLTAGSRCGDAPFIFPTDGMVGFLRDDSFRIGHRHQGIDIFGGDDVGVTPVIAAYPGYLTRLPDWKSSVIVRIPSDPLNPGRQIWIYYTHMATKDGISFISDGFPPGTYEKFIDAGTLLGYQGNYSGDPNNPTGVHLHFSVVKDDGQGGFRNELEIKNTYDLSPYLGLPVNANKNTDTVPVCENE
jgi:murein DD-endopeptidase MepM/ murein hydrolase activator NlpD